MESRSPETQPAFFERLEPRLLLSGSEIIPQDAGAFSSEWFSVLSEETAVTPVVDASSGVQAINVNGEEYLPGYMPGQWIVRFTDDAASTMNAVADAAYYLDGEVDFNVLKGLGRKGLVLIETPGVSEDAAAAWLAGNPDIEYFQLNYIAAPSATHPDDPYYPFDYLWGLNNEGFLYGPETLDNDIDAPEAWDITVGSDPNPLISGPLADPDDVISGEEVVVAVIDTGVDWRHPDLQQFNEIVDYELINSNIWHNPGEIAPGMMGVPGVYSDTVFPLRDDSTLDDTFLVDEDEDTYDPDIFGGNTDKIDGDANGFVDDLFGYDFGAGDWDPSPDTPADSHGTHVAGTIGAIGNNALGVVGVNWEVSIMALKVIDEMGAFADDAIISAINYCTYMKTEYGVNIVASNNSWGRPIVPSEAYEEAIEGNRDAGILFVVAAGNDGTNNDAVPQYPSNYSLQFDNVVSVAATDPFDQKADFSNYGEESVHIGAPGVDIWSTWAGEYYQREYVLDGGVWRPVEEDDDIPSIYDPGDPKPGAEPSYNMIQGTSMAAPHVAGAAALLSSVVPSASYIDLKNAMLKSVDRIPDLQGATTTGGRLNVYKAILALTGSSISGTVYEDFNTADGVAYNPGGGDAPLAGVQVFLDYATETEPHGNGFRDPWEPLTTTDLNGEYLFTDLAAGTYYVRLLLPVDAAINRNEDGYVGWTMTEPFITAAAADDVTRRALLIDAYGADDIDGMRTALLNSSGGEWSPTNITMLDFGSATLANVQNAIANLEAVTDDNDLALIYFASHGDLTGADGGLVPLDEDGTMPLYPVADNDDGFLIMDDGDLVDDTLGGWVSAFDAATLVDGQFVMIYDACHSGDMLDGTADPAGQVTNHVMLTAADRDELSYDDAAGIYGIFTGHIIDALGSPAADLNVDGYISAEEAYWYAEPLSRNDSLALYADEQFPQMSDTFAGELNLTSLYTSAAGVAYWEVTVGDLNSVFDIDFGLIDSRPEILPVNGETTMNTPYETDLTSTDLHPSAVNETAPDDMLYFLLDESGNPVTSVTTDAGTFTLDQATTFGAIPDNWHVGDTLVGTDWEGEIQSIDAQLTFAGPEVPYPAPTDAVLTFDQVPYLNNQAWLTLDGVPANWAIGDTINDGVGGDWNGTISQIDAPTNRVQVLLGGDSFAEVTNAVPAPIPYAVQNPVRGTNADLLAAEGPWDPGNHLVGTFWEGDIVWADPITDQVGVDLTAGDFHDIVPGTIQNTDANNTATLTVAQGTWDIGDTLQGSGWTGTIMDIDGTRTIIDVALTEGSFGDITDGGLPEAVTNLDRNNTHDLNAAVNQNSIVFDLTGGTYDDVIAEPILNTDRGTVANLTGSQNNHLVYTPAQDFFGQATVDYIARDTGNEMFSGQGPLLWFDPVPRNWEVGDIINDGGDWDAEIVSIDGKWVNIDLALGATVDTFAEITVEEIFNPARQNSADLVEASPPAVPENYGESDPAAITIDVFAPPVAGDVTTVVRQNGNTMVFLPVTDADAPLLPGDIHFNFADDPLAADADGTMAFSSIDPTDEGFWFTYTGPGAGTFDRFTYTYRDGDGYLSNIADVDLGLADVTPIIPGSPVTLNLHGDNQVIISIYGPGNGEVYAPPAGWPGAPNSDIDAESLIFNGTTDRTRVTIRTRGRGVEFDLGDLNVNGDIRMINARTTNILGDVNIAGSATSLSLDDINALSQQTFDILGPNELRRFSCDRIRNLNFTSAAPINSFRATEWVDDNIDPGGVPDFRDTLDAPSINSLLVRGDRREGLAGVFGPELTLNSVPADDPTLRRAVIMGGVNAWNLDGTSAPVVWDITGNVGTIQLNRSDEMIVDWTLGTGTLDNIQRLFMNRAGDVSVDVNGEILNLRATRWNDGVVDADSIRRLNITGGRLNRWTPIDGDFGADLNLTFPGDFSLRSARIRGAVSGTWNILGNVGRLDMGTLETGANVLSIFGDARMIRVRDEALVLNDPDGPNTNPETEQTGELFVGGQARNVRWNRDGVRDFTTDTLYASSNGGLYSLEELLYQINRDNPNGGDWDFLVTGRNSNGLVFAESTVDWADIRSGETHLRGKAYYYYNVTEAPRTAGVDTDIAPETMSLFFDSNGNLRMNNWAFEYNNGENNLDIDMVDRPVIAPAEMEVGVNYRTRTNFNGTWGSGIDTSGELFGWQTSGQVQTTTRLLGTEYVAFEDGTAYPDPVVKGMTTMVLRGRVDFHDGRQWRSLPLTVRKRQTWWADPNTGVVKSETRITIRVGRNRYYQTVTNERI